MPEDPDADNYLLDLFYRSSFVELPDKNCRFWGSFCILECSSAVRAIKRCGKPAQRQGDL